MIGRIVSLSCGIYSISSDGVIYKAPARGLFRKKSLKPVVGDIVEFDDINFIILDIKERTSLLKRPPIANIDQMFIVCSLVEPDFSYLLAFKYLTYANMNNVKAKIILTKIDKFKDEEKLEEIKKTFTQMGIDVYCINNKTGEGIAQIKPLFSSHVTCFIGQTGVGKSSLANAIDPNYERMVGEYSKALGRGKHETKEVILLPYANGLIADTPGFSSLELDLYKEDLAIYFPGFHDLYVECYYSNCLHLSENKCAIKKALEEGKISPIAYECYKRLSQETIYKSKRYE